MEITLEKIDLIRERAGVSYADARDILSECGGDVVEALVRLEAQQKAQQATSDQTGNFDHMAGDVVDKVKSLWAKGTDTKIKLVKGEETLFDMPLTAGLVGAILAPQAALAGAIVAYASKCSISIEKPQKVQEEDASQSEPNCETQGQDAGMN